VNFFVNLMIFAEKPVTELLIGLGRLGNLCSSAASNQVRLTLILTPFPADYIQGRLTIE